ncbi:MAG TPA: hypothetical protein VHY79_03765 [Rhizomicrobium sp.]|jgi:hypothetical protein|nr:hypothetical protein [Rhizomicrobium sp.]
MPLQPPPREADGRVIPHDHQGINPEDILIRRISEQHLTGEAGNRRISSMAFQESTDGSGMSIDIAKLIEESGLDPHNFVTTSEYFCSVQFATHALRGEGFQVGYYPVPGNDFHGAVWGIVTRGQKKRIRSLAQWYVEAGGISLDG